MRLRKKPWIPQALEEYRGKELLEDGLEQYRGQWSQQVLGGRPVQLEIGCGKGQFLAAMQASSIRKSATWALKPSGMCAITA